MTVTSRACASILGTAAIAASLVMTSEATASAETHTSGATEHCATIVSKKLDKNGASAVIGQMACSTTSAADALAKSASTVAGVSSATAVKSATLLLNEYLDRDYGGGVIYSYYGNAGPCDYSGYHLVNYVRVEINVSSMIGYNNCTAVTVNDEDFDYETYDLPVPYLGAFNDNVVALQVFNG